MLTKDDVIKVASLARLEFSESETDEFTQQLAKIVTFVEQLGEVSTDQVEEMAHPLDIHTVVRADQAVDGLSREQALKNAPNHDAEYFLVPPVMARN